MLFDTQLPGDVALPRFTLFTIVSIFSVLIPILSLQSKDKEHIFWKSKTSPEKIVFVLLFWIVNLLIRLLFSYFVFFSTIIYPIFTFGNVVKTSFVIVLDFLFWFVFNRLDIVEKDKPLVVKHLAGYLLELMIFILLIGFMGDLLITPAG